MAGNPDFNLIASITLKKYRRKLVDNIFNENPLLYWLMKGDRIELESGGQTIVEPLLFGKNTTIKSYTNLDSIDLFEQQGISAAEYQWKGVAGSVVFSGMDKRKNSGSDTQIIKLISSKIEQAELSMKETINTMVYSDGTGNGGKDLNGLGNIVSTTAILGGIDPAAAGNSWWQSKIDTAAVALTVTLMSHQYNQVSQSSGVIHPDLILTTQLLYEKYEALLQANQRFNDSSKADGSFQTLLYRGSSMIWDLACPATFMYFLNSKFLKLTVHKEANFTTSPFEKIQGQDGWFALVLMNGNLLTNNRRYQGLMTNKTP